MAFLSPGGEDYARLLASPAAQFLPSPGLFASPGPGGGLERAAKEGPAVREGRLSFDVLLQDHEPEGEAAAGGGLQEDGGALKEATCLKAARSASHLELFALAERTRSDAAAAAAAAPAAEEQAHLAAALTQKVVDSVVAAKQQEAQELVAGVAAKYGLAADYVKAEETIKAVWAGEAPGPLPGSAQRAAAAQQQALSQKAAGEEDEPTLAVQPRLANDNASYEEEAGSQATSTLQPLAAGANGSANALKRPLASQPSFSFRAGPAHQGAAGDAALKRRRMQYDRMRELEAQVQRERHLGDALKQSLRQAEDEHTKTVAENEQLWNALLHIQASLRAAHSALLRQQVAMHAAAVAAALPPPMSAQVEQEPSPNLLFGGLFSPGADDELAAACGMFISPAKPGTAATAAATNKPRKLFLEEDAKGTGILGSVGRTPLGGLPAELSPALWVQAAS